MKTGSLIAGSLIAALGLVSVPGAAGATTPPDEPEFCAPWQTATALFNTDGPVDPAVAEQALADVTAAAPDELAESAEVVVAAATLAASGDFSGFDSPDFQVAVGEVDNWVFDQCPFDGRIDVQAVDWAFGDIPLEISAGSVAFRLSNLGDELHEMAIVRVAEGTTETLQELEPLLAVQDPAAMEKIEFVAGAFSPGPDAPGVAFADLEPGEYAAICFIPVGTLQEMAAEGGADESAPADTAAAGTTGTSAEGSAPTDTGGSMPEEPPADGLHAAHGMVQHFTVVEGS